MTIHALSMNLLFSLSLLYPTLYSAEPDQNVTVEEIRRVDKVLEDMRSQPVRAITPELFPQIKPENIITILGSRIDKNENDSDRDSFRARLVLSICFLSIFSDSAIKDQTTIAVANQKLMDSIDDVQKSNYTISQLMKFPLSSFSDSTKKKAEGLFTNGKISASLIRLVGKLEIKTLLPQLQILAGFPAQQISQFKWHGDPATEMLQRQDWSAALSMARFGEKVSLEVCIKTIQERIDQRGRYPLISLGSVCQTLGHEIVFMSNEKSHRILLNWLNNMLPDKEDHEGMQNAAVELLASSVVDCPSANEVYDPETLDGFKKWFVDNPNYIIRK